MRTWVQKHTELEKMEAEFRARAEEAFISDLEQLTQTLRARAAMNRDRVEGAATFLKALQDCGGLEHVENKLLEVKLAFDSGAIGASDMIDHANKLLV